MISRMAPAPYMLSGDQGNPRSADLRPTPSPSNFAQTKRPSRLHRAYQAALGRPDPAIPPHPPTGQHPGSHLRMSRPRPESYSHTAYIPKQVSEKPDSNKRMHMPICSRRHTFSLVHLLTNLLWILLEIFHLQELPNNETP